MGGRGEGEVVVERKDGVMVGEKENVGEEGRSDGK